MSHLIDDSTPLLRDASTSTGYDSTLHEVEQDSHALPPAAGIPTKPVGPQAPENKKWIPSPDAEWKDPKHPEQRARPRTLVLCFDGTGDQFDDDVSNVSLLSFSSLTRPRRDVELERRAIPCSIEER
jgi:hypothetical protein